MASGYFVGKITDCNTANPIRGANVTILGTSALFTTGRNGGYCIELPPCGASSSGCPGYTIRVRAPGYTRKDTPDKHIRSGQIEPVDICLKPV
mgnify:CR=1 FL=1